MQRELVRNITCCMIIKFAALRKIFFAHAVRDLKISLSCPIVVDNVTVLTAFSFANLMMVNCVVSNVHYSKASFENCIYAG